MRIENSRRALDDQAVEIGRPDGFRKGRAEPVEEIEDQRLFDLDLFVRPLQLRDSPALDKPGGEPSDQACDKQPEEKRWPHASGPDYFAAGS